MESSVTLLNSHLRLTQNSVYERGMGAYPNFFDKFLSNSLQKSRHYISVAFPMSCTLLSVIKRKRIVLVSWG